MDCTSSVTLQKRARLGAKRMKRKLTRRDLAVLALVAFLCIPPISSNSFAAQKTGKQKRPLAVRKAVRVIELGEIDQLKEAFQRDAGKVRLVTILSPT
jgi:hypothetical protein